MAKKSSTDHALKDRWVLITGASGGIGEAIACELYAAGAKLILVGRDAQKLQMLRTRYQFAQGQSVMLVADINSAAGRKIIQAFCERLPEPLSVLVNNAGLSDFHFLEQQAPAKIASLIQTNLLSPILLTQALLPVLQKAPSPLIVNIGSTFGSIGYPGYAAYCASKFGLRGFSEALRRELADTPVDVCYVAPRATQTGINSDLVNEMNTALGNAMDDTARVAAEVRKVIEKRCSQTFIGWPEKLFARINQILPGIVDGALRKQLPLIRQFSQRRTNP